MNLDDEAMVYYSNNSVKKFEKKPMNINFKNSSIKKSYSTSSSGIQHKGVEKV